MAIITVDDLKEHLKPGSISGSQHDPTIATATAATIGAVIRFCGRSFEKTSVGSETARVYDRSGRSTWHGIESSSSAVVHDIWDVTNLVVATDDGDSGTFTAWDAGDYQMEPLNHLDGDAYSPHWRVRAVNGRSFPCGHRRPALRVTAAWGWAMVPDDVKQAALIKAASVWTRRESPQGVAGFGEFGVVRISRQQDPHVADLLNPFRHPKMLARAAVA